MSESKYEKVNLEEWNRSDAYLFYKSYSDPLFNITANVPTTRLYHYCKETKSSFFLNSLFYSLQAANAVPEFRLRLLENDLVVFENICVGSTILRSDNSFCFCYFDYTKDKEVFLKNGEESINLAKNTKNLEPKKGVVDIIFHSVVPWISFTSIKHARNEGKMDSIPKIVFGKYFQQGDEWMLPVSVEANHAMMDGFHVGQYFNNLEKLIG